MDPLGTDNFRDKWEAEGLSPISSSVSTPEVPRRFAHTAITARTLRLEEASGRPILLLTMEYLTGNKREEGMSNFKRRP